MLSANLASSGDWWLLLAFQCKEISFNSKDRMAREDKKEEGKKKEDKKEDKKEEGKKEEGKKK